MSLLAVITAFPLPKSDFMYSFPGSTPPNTSITKDGVIQRVIHPKRPANTKDGVYEILKIDEKFQTYWLRTLDGETITTAKRGYIQDFASEAAVAA